MSGPHQNSPKHPAYSTYHARETTFEKGWPTTLPMQQIPLIMNGLFYTGFSDKTVCHHCSGGFHNLTANCDILELHVMFFPMCGFINKHFPSQTLIKLAQNIPSQKHFGKTFIPNPEDLALTNQLAPFIPTTINFSMYQLEEMSRKIKVMRYQFEVIREHSLRKHQREVKKLNDKIKELGEQCTKYEKQLFDWYSDEECPQC